MGEMIWFCFFHGGWKPRYVAGASSHRKFSKELTLKQDSFVKLLS